MLNYMLLALALVFSFSAKAADANQEAILAEFLKKTELAPTSYFFGSSNSELGSGDWYYSASYINSATDYSLDQNPIRIRFIKNKDQVKAVRMDIDKRLNLDVTSSLRPLVLVVPVEWRDYSVSGDKVVENIEKSWGEKAFMNIDFESLRLVEEQLPLNLGERKRLESISFSKDSFSVTNSYLDCGITVRHSFQRVK